MRFKNFLKKRKPDILTFVGLGGMVAFGLMMYKAYPVVQKELENEAEGKEEPLTKKETAWVYVRTMWPTILVGVGSSVCVVMGNREHNKRSAALAAAYYISESTLKTYQDKVIEEIGEKKEHAIREKAAIQRQQDNPPREDIIASPNDRWSYDKIFYDTFTDKYFRINPEKLERARAEFNLMMAKSYNNTGSIKDLYDLFEIPISYDWDNWEWEKDTEDWELYFDKFETVGEIRGVLQNYTIFEYNHRPRNRYSK